MSKNSVLGVLIGLSFLAAGCASSGPKKPTIFVEQHNSIPADVPSQFDSRYERFISGKEMKAFHKLQTDEERQAFQDKFWAERDPDPSTPENEEKDRIDRLIDDIASERFFGGLTGGLLFRSNGGFRGEMAHVYLLHGEPDAMDMIDGQSFVNLMLWVYVDQRNGDILYAFLFYQRGGNGSFQLFSQDSYQLDPCGAVNEVRTFSQFSGRMGECAPDTESILQEIYQSPGKAGVIDGHIFVWALFNFSQDGSINQGKALQPPKPASEIARLSGARVAGEAPHPAGTAGTDFILASCRECKSFLPAELRLTHGHAVLRIRRSDIDWSVTDGQAEAKLKIRVVLESGKSPPVVFEKTETIRENRDAIVSDPSGVVEIDVLAPEEEGRLPGEVYRGTVYIKNLLTGKYNVWVREFVR